MADNPDPIGPRQEWHQRESIEYLMTADRAILDIASKMREDFLFRIYRAGKNSIERGSTDYWTITPKRVAALQALAGDAPAAPKRLPAATLAGAGAEAAAASPSNIGISCARRIRAIRAAISFLPISRIFPLLPSS